MANLIFYRMSKDSPEEEQKDSGKNKRRKSAYNDQTLQLSKFFKAWKKLKRSSDDAVESAKK